VVLRDTSGSRIAFAYGAVTLSGGPFQATSASEPICNSLQESQLPLVGPTTPRLQRLRPITQPRFGLLRFRSPLLTECSLFLEVLRCFSSLGVLDTAYVFNRASQGITPGGFPHSDISGSTLARNSPKHFAACHVLRRLLAPRHPPHALSSLTYSVHAASTVLAVATMRSRRNLLDEIDASTLRLIRSCARRSGARHVRLVRLGPFRPAARAFRSDARRRIRPGVSELSADRWAPPTSRAAVRRPNSNVGLSQRTRGEPEWVSPREPSNNSTAPRDGQGGRRSCRAPPMAPILKPAQVVSACSRFVRWPCCPVAASRSAHADSRRLRWS
jgi:hypothetical protein